MIPFVATIRRLDAALVVRPYLVAFLTLWPTVSQSASVSGKEISQTLLSDGVDIWKWSTAVDKPLCLFHFSAATGTYLGNPFCIYLASANAGAPSGEFVLNQAINATVSAAPPGAHSVNFWSVVNTGHNGGAGHSFNYISNADGSQFDIALSSLAIFRPSSFANNMPKHNHFFWAVSPQDNLAAASTKKAFGTGVAEWNVTNEGADFGFDRLPRAALAQHSFGLLMVPENVDPQTQVRLGLNASFAYSASQNVGNSVRQTPQATFTGSITAAGVLTAYNVKGEIVVGQSVTSGIYPALVNYGQIKSIEGAPGGPNTYDLNQKPAAAISSRAMTSGPFEQSKFYVDYLVEANSVAGLTGRGIYETGDISNTPMLVPYSPHQIDGTWLHGLDMTQASFKDGDAIHVATGQSVALDTAGAVKLTSNGTDVSLPKGSSFKNGTQSWTAYVPAITIAHPGSAPPRFSMPVARYSKTIDATVRFSINFRVTAIGTGSGAINVRIPVTTSFSTTPVSCIDLSTGRVLFAKIDGGGNVVTIGGVAGNDGLSCSGFYESQ